MISSAAALAVVLATTPAPPVHETPSLRVEAESRLVLSRLPPIARLDGHEKWLSSGLTATFAFRVQLLGRRGAAGAARVDVRYELWDEQFEVAAVGSDGVVRTAVLPTRAALDTWWAELELPVLERSGAAPPEAGGPAGALEGKRARVIVEVVPFSRREQLETQRWFTESIRRAEGARGDEASRATDGRSGAVDRMLELLLATSIRRRVIASGQWIVEINEGR